MKKYRFRLRSIGLAASFIGLLSAPAWALPRPVNVDGVGFVRAPQDVFLEKDFFKYADRRLYNIEEPSLWATSKDANTRVFRFLYVPGDRNALSIRIEFAGPKKARLIWKTFEGQQAVDWGKVVDEGEMDLTAEQINLFDYEFNRLNYWFIDREAADSTRTGDLWLMEGAEYGKYHAVPRISPKEGLLYEFETFLVRFSGLDESLVLRERPTSGAQTPDVETQ